MACLLYKLSMSSQDEYHIVGVLYMLETTQIIANIVVVIGVIIAVIQLWQNKRIAKADHERRKKEATIVFTHEIITKSSEFNNIIVRIFGDDTINITDDRYINTKDGDLPILEIIKRHLNLLERISVGLNTGVYDIDVFARICGQRIIKSWNRLQNVIVQRRKENHQESLYIEFEEVVESLKKRKAKPRNVSGNIEHSL